MSNEEHRAELASIAASLRAYLEWQVDCGSSGIPRLPRQKRAAAAPTAGDAPPPPAPTADAEGAAPPPPEPRAPRPSAATTREPLPAFSLPEKVAFASAIPAAPPPPPPPAAAAPRPLHVLEDEVRGCTKCGLAATRTNTVFARGNPTAKLCFIGEAPGADEDAQGIPFVGRAGQLLDKMIKAMGLDPEKDVYVINIIKCRPPGNRRPEPEEVEACIPYLHDQIVANDPKVIVALGNTSVAALLGTKIGITKVRGAWKLYRGKIPVMPTYHPSYLLRPGPTQAEAKRQVWEDLQTVMKELGLPPRPAGA